MTLSKGGFIDGGSVAYLGGILDGTLTLRNGSLATSAAAGPANFVLLQSNTLSGDIGANQTLWVEGTTLRQRDADGCRRGEPTTAPSCWQPVNYYGVETP